ncbi:MAG: hypothetical protein RLY20_3537, partial [Verrucomicrobiota bacterium]
MRQRFLVAVMFWVAMCVGGLLSTARAQGLQRFEFKVDGVMREALIHVPATAKSSAAPVVFIFHGHGGNMRQAARSFGIEKLWPEAICIYMQGLPTPGAITDPKGEKNGWQARVGVQGDRDLKFFDAVLARLKSDYKVDEKRIYSTGHSNGGAFTYLLWAERGDVFAAMAPSAAVFVQARQLKPKPVMHLAGDEDPLVKYQWQKTMMEAERRLNGCEPEGKPWAEQCTLYPSKGSTPVVTFIFHGGHEFKPEAPALIVRFLK